VLLPDWEWWDSVCTFLSCLAESKLNGRTDLLFTGDGEAFNVCFSFGSRCESSAEMFYRSGNSLRRYLHMPGQIWVLAFALDSLWLERHGTLEKKKHYLVLPILIRLSQGNLHYRFIDPGRWCQST